MKAKPFVLDKFSIFIEQGQTGNGGEVKVEITGIPATILGLESKGSFSNAARRR